MSKMKTASGSIDIGISAAERKQISRGLSALLADSYTLYLMTHNFHWNVTGPQFNSLHLMFMAQYTEQWNALDIIAERIRALGHPAPGTYKEFVKLASIKEVDGVPRQRSGPPSRRGADPRPLSPGGEGSRPADGRPAHERLEVHEDGLDVAQRVEERILRLRRLWSATEQSLQLVHSFHRLLCGGRGVALFRRCGGLSGCRGRRGPFIRRRGGGRSRCGCGRGRIGRGRLRFGLALRADEVSDLCDVCDRHPMPFSATSSLSANTDTHAAGLPGPAR